MDNRLIFPEPWKYQHWTVTRYFGNVCQSMASGRRRSNPLVERSCRFLGFHRVKIRRLWKPWCEAQHVGKKYRNNFLSICRWSHRVNQCTCLCFYRVQMSRHLLSVLLEWPLVHDHRPQIFHRLVKTQGQWPLPNSRITLQGQLVCTQASSGSYLHLWTL